MKRLFATLALTGLVLLNGEARQPRASACRIHVEIAGERIVEPAKSDITSCFYNSNLILVATNLDNQAYRVELRAFRQDAANPTECDSSDPHKSPFKNASADLSVNVQAEDANDSKKQLKLNAMSGPKECFKFDVVLRKGGTVYDTLDPQLEISEPPPPPPPPPPPAGPAATKKPPVGL
jgi:hypothetical protein